MAKQKQIVGGKSKGKRKFEAKFEEDRQGMVVNIQPKNEAQAYFLNALRTQKIIVANGSAGTGKAQPLYSKILTPNGWTTMGQLKIGDTVVGSKGNVTVTGIFPQGEKEVYRFTMADGGTVESCVDHLWTVDSNKNPFPNGRKLSKKKRSIMTTADVVELLNSGGNGNISVPQLSVVQYNRDEELPLHPYLLGFLLGDGSLTTATPHFSTADEELVAKVSGILGETFSVNYLSKYDYSISDSSATWKTPNRVTTALKQLGVHGQTSATKFVPEVYKFASVEERYELLQGLLDSDGTVANRTGAVSFCSTSKQLATDVRDIVLSLGGKSSISQTTKYFTYKGEKKKGLPVYIVSINVEDKQKLFTLKRQQEKVSPTDISQLSRNIASAERVGMVECQCIMVDSEDHLYVTDDFVLTHNTFMAATHAANRYLADSRLNIYLSRPYVTMGRSAGLLPGTAEEKMAPFLAPLTSVLKKQLGKKYEADFGKNIHIQLIEAIRGMDLQNAILLIDEGQNLTVDEIKSVVTRIGDNAQIIITGDSYQSDLKKGESGLEWLCNLIEDYNIKGADFVEFGPEDIVRSGMVKEFIMAFDKEGEKGK